MTSKERVSQVYPDAQLVGWTDGACAIHVPSARKYLGCGQEKFNVSSIRAAQQAWDDAASNLPSAPSPAGETASEPVSTEGAAHIMRCPRCSIVDGVYCDEWRKLHPTTTVAAPIAPAAPVPKGTMPHRFESKIQGAICSHCDQPWFSSLHPEPAAKPSAEGDGWIAVTEKKPEVRDWVLAVDSSEGNVEVFLYVRRGFIRCPGGCTAYVTHWRPLPAPPSGQGEKR